MKKLLLTMLCLILITPLFADQTNRKNIAVIDLESRGSLTKEESGALTDRLRSMLVRTNAFNVVDRGRMNDILKEQGFQLSGCTSAECAVEAGKILGVQQMVSGTIGRVGKLYTVDIILIDVATSKIIKSLTRDYKGEIEGLVGLMKSIADELAGVNKKEAISGGIQVESNPSQAQLYVDGKLIGVTPATVANLSPGAHHLKISKDGFAPFEKQLIVESGKTKPYSALLKKMFTLSIFSNPEQASILINNQYKGETPLKQQIENNSKLTILVKKDNYEPFKKEMLIRKNETLRINLKLAALSISGKTAVKKPKSSSHLWLWLGGGAAVAGAAAYFIIPKKSSSPETPYNTNVAFPGPPGRPH